MLKTLKKYYSRISLAIIVFLFFFGLTSQWYLARQIKIKERLQNEIQSLLNEYAGLVSQYMQLKKISNKATEELRELYQRTSDYERKIQALSSSIEAKNKEIESLRREISALDETLTSLVARENQGTCEERIDNLTQQRDIWIKKFSLCKEEIAKKDEIIFSLSEKYTLERTLRLDWEKKANEEYGLRVQWQSQAENTLQELDKANKLAQQTFNLLKREQTKSRWYRYGLYVLSGIVIFSLVK